MRQVTYRESEDSFIDETRVNWGGNDDPRGVLVNGRTYTVSKTEPHSMHTKLELLEHPGLMFNSVHFDDAADLV